MHDDHRDPLRRSHEEARQILDPDAREAELNEAVSAIDTRPGRAVIVDVDPETGSGVVRL